MGGVACVGGALRRRLLYLQVPQMKYYIDRNEDTSCEIYIPAINKVVFQDKFNEPNNV